MDTSTHEFLWQVEEACFNAYPASREILLGGWLLRGSGGRTRRTNSVNPLPGGPRDPTPILPEAERLYQSLGRPTLFRVPSFMPETDAVLARLGYQAQGETRTLFADLRSRSFDESKAVELSNSPDGGWYDDWASLIDDASPPIISAYRRAVGTLLLPTAFACRRVGHQPVAVAYAAVHRGFAVLESVITHRSHRQRGHAGDVIQALLAWAERQGAIGACLQVASDNAPARALYAAAGFDRECYRYHYREQPTVRHSS